MEEWCILRVVGESVQTLGYVWAPDEAAAISEAKKKFGFDGREQELVAHRVPRTPQSK
jgi:hypothetical protein